MYELQTLHPIIEERANKLLNNVVEYYETITPWKQPTSNKLSNEAPFYSQAKYKYTDGTHLYFELYDTYEKKSLQSLIPFQWLLDEDEWKAYITLYATTVKEIREKTTKQVEEDKRKYDLERLKELIEKYYDEAYEMVN